MGGKRNMVKRCMSMAARKEWGHWGRERKEKGKEGNSVITARDMDTLPENVQQKEREKEKAKEKGLKGKEVMGQTTRREKGKGTEKVMGPS
jgi:hypothetical protein